MKTYKYKFSKLITAFIWIGIVLSVLGLGFNIYLIATGNFNEPYTAYTVLRYILVFFVTIALFVILISLLISSYYSVDEKYLKTSFGIIKSKFELSNIETVHLTGNRQKLSVHFKDGNFIVIVVKSEWYEDFIGDVLKANPKIEYVIDPEDKSGKKS